MVVAIYYILLKISNSDTKYPFRGRGSHPAALIISAKTPDAVTSAPAPAPLTTSGCSVYLFV